MKNSRKDKNINGKWKEFGPSFTKSFNKFIISAQREVKK